MPGAVRLSDFCSTIRQDVDHPDQFRTWHFRVETRVMLAQMSNSDNSDFHHLNRALAADSRIRVDPAIRDSFIPSQRS